MPIDKKLVSGCYDDWAKQYDKDSLNNAAIGVDRPIILTMIENMGFGTVGLDLGCGTGLMMKEIAPKVKKIIGIDLSSGMIEKAADNLKGIDNTELINGDFVSELAGFETESFDFIISSLAICHIDELEVLFLEINRVLKSGGVFVFDDIISKLNKSFTLKHTDYLGEYSQKGQIWQRRTKEDYINLLEKVGFKIVEITETQIDKNAEKFLAPLDYKNNQGCGFTIIIKSQK